MFLPFSPEHYLEVAKQLYEQKELGEAGLRASMSRAYYAAFLVARDVAQLDYRDQKNSHELVINHYQASRLANHKMVANDLRLLKENRKKADYFTNAICIRKEGGDSLRLSEKVITVLRSSLSAKPTKQAPSRTP